MDDIEPILDGMIKQLQQNNGVVSSGAFDARNDGANAHRWAQIQSMLANFGLIQPGSVNAGFLTLTQKGWEFESFEKLREEKKLQKDLIMSNIAAAAATEKVSNETTKFYPAQTKYNRWQIFLTCAILLSSAIYTYVTFLSYNVAKSPSRIEQRLEELERKIQTQETQDSVFQNSVRDSLKMPQKSN